jgi:signal transduction histidine kinase
MRDERMENNNQANLEVKNADLEYQLHEAKNLIQAIRNGEVDALLLNKDGKADVYSLENIDYTYRILIEKFAEAAISISDDGLIRYCNSYFSHLIKIPMAKIVGTYLYEYLPSKASFLSILKKIKNGIYKGEINLELDGEIIPVYLSLTSLAPNLSGYGIILNDQTAKKKSEETILGYQKQLEQKIKVLYRTNGDLEQFLHVVSHDIREPLRKIVTYGTLLKNEFAPALEQGAVKYIDIMNTASTRLNALMEDLVHYSYVGTESSSLEKVDPNKLLTEIVNDIETIVISKGAKITWDVLPMVNASRFQMRQLFTNLIINALKYSKEGIAPELHVSAEVSAQERFGGVDGKTILYHKINFDDNGIGIEEKYMNKIFVIFQRLHGIKEYSGTGIGLAICKRIVENHNGKIEVTSVVNEGSTFSVYLPVVL